KTLYRRAVIKIAQDRYWHQIPQLTQSHLTLSQLPYIVGLERFSAVAGALATKLCTSGAKPEETTSH
ncbi:Putative F-box/kelch-repeat protein, partial [Frankliniella fusca]